MFLVSVEFDYINRGVFINRVSILHLAKWLQKQSYNDMQLMVLSSVITCPASNYRFLKTKISTGDKHLLHEVM